VLKQPQDHPLATRRASLMAGLQKSTVKQQAPPAPF
jgi:hypothetical protein